MKITTLLNSLAVTIQTERTYTIEAGAQNLDIVQE